MVSVSLQDGQDIPNSNHVVRYCSPKHVQSGKILATAFQIKESEKYISVNWLEYFNGSMTSQQRMQHIQNSIALTIKPAGKFAKVSVATAKQAIQDLRIAYHPTELDRSHAGIYYPQTDNNRGYALALSNLVKSNHIISIVL